MTPAPFRATAGDQVSHAATFYASEAATKTDALFVFAHGAGGGQSSAFMVRYATALAARGIDVVTFDFPYMEAGRGAPDRAPVLEDAFRRVIAGAVAYRAPDSPGHDSSHARRLFIGGKSMGGRMATHVAAAMDQWPADVPPLAGVIVFGYPLNPPGGPSKRSPDRVSHLSRITVPTLVVQGTRDNFGGPDQITSALSGQRHTISVFGVEGGDHSLSSRSKTTATKMDESVWDKVIAWIDSVRCR